MKALIKPIAVFTLFLTLAALPLHGADVDDLSYDASGATVIITDCEEAAAGELVLMGRS